VHDQAFCLGLVTMVGGQHDLAELHHEKITIVPLHLDALIVAIPLAQGKHHSKIGISIMVTGDNRNGHTFMPRCSDVDGSGKRPNRNLDGFINTR